MSETKELRYSHNYSDYPILYGLRDCVTGILYGDQLVDSFINNPFNRRYIFFGPPGSGKSAAGNDFIAAVEEILQSHNITLHAERLTYDQVYSEIAQSDQKSTYGISPSSSRWDPVYNSELGLWIRPNYYIESQTLLDQARSSSIITAPNTSQDRFMQVLEFPGISGLTGHTAKEAIRNRGFTTLQALAQDAKDADKTGFGTQVTGIFGSPEMQEFSLGMRREVRSLPDAEVITHMQDFYRIQVIGFENLSPELRGKMIKDDFEWAPQPEHIVGIRSEILNAALRLLKDKIFKEKLNSIYIPTESLVKKRIFRGLKLTGLFMLDTFDRVGLGYQQAGNYLVNPFGGLVANVYRPDIKRRYCIEGLTVRD